MAEKLANRNFFLYLCTTKKDAVESAPTVDFKI